MYHSFLIHSSADGHLGCFYVLAILNSAAMNTRVHVSLSILVLSFKPPFQLSSFTFIRRFFSSFPFLPFSSVQFSSVTQSCPTLCNPMNCSTPGLPVHHQLPEFTRTHVHRVGDAIQPSHPLSSPYPPAPNTSQHQNYFQ